MDAQFQAYLKLLDSLREGVEQLEQLAHEKTEAVRNDDLMALDAVLRQEQAIALSFRGIEQKRIKLLSDLGMGDVPLSQLPGHFPPSMQMEARKSVEALQTQFKLYKSSAKIARNTLESNLHEIEKVLAALGATPAEGPGYQPPEVQPPKSMKTDFRA